MAIKTKQTRVLVSLEQSLYEWIKEKSSKLGVSMSLFLRDLAKRERDEEETKYFMRLSEKSFNEIWDNDEDSVYDSL